jgi:hypothetical protein
VDVENDLSEQASAAPLALRRMQDVEEEALFLIPQAALGIADHRYSAKAPTRVDSAFFFQTETTVAADR